jgi:hypothetical protein
MLEFLFGGQKKPLLLYSPVSSSVTERLRRFSSMLFRFEISLAVTRMPFGFSPVPGMRYPLTSAQKGVLSLRSSRYSWLCSFSDIATRPKSDSTRSLSSGRMKSKTLRPRKSDRLFNPNRSSVWLLAAVMLPSGWMMTMALGSISTIER